MFLQLSNKKLVLVGFLFIGSFLICHPVYADRTESFGNSVDIPSGGGNRTLWNIPNAGTNEYFSRWESSFSIQSLGGGNNPSGFVSTGLCGSYVYNDFNYPFINPPQPNSVTSSSCQNNADLFASVDPGSAGIRIFWNATAYYTCLPGYSGNPCVPPAPTCPDPAANNFGGALPCTYPSGPVPGAFNLSSSACHNNGIYDLSWTSSSDATSYDVYVWSGGSLSYLGSTGGLNWSTTQAVGQDWVFRVVAVNANGTFTRDVDPVDCPAAAITLSAAPVTINLGSPNTMSWTGSGDPSNWITFYRVENPPIPDGPYGAGPVQYIDWRYTNCTKTTPALVANGNCSWTPPSVGTYEYRMFFAGTWTRIATSNPYTVVDPSSATIFVNSDKPTTWQVTGPSASYSGGDWPGISTPTTTGTYSPVTAGTYSIVGHAIAGYTGPSILNAANGSPGTPQTVNNASSITFNLHYLANPTGLTASAQPACGSVLFTWDDIPDPNRTGYGLYSGPSGGPFVTQVGPNLSPNTTEYTFTAAPTGNTWYQLKAFGTYLTTTSNVSSAFVPACAANVTTSNKVITFVNASPYSPSTVIKNGDSVTFKIILRNTGTDSANINGISDVLSPNLTNITQVQIDKGSGPANIANLAAVTGVKCSSLNDASCNNWIITFKTTASLPGANLFTNDATINCTSVSSGAACNSTARATHLNAAGGSKPPQFREVAP